MSDSPPHPTGGAAPPPESAIPAPRWARRNLAGLVSVGLGVAYGLAARLLFALDHGSRHALADGFFGVMSASFLYLVPPVIGLVFVLSHPREAKLTKRIAFFGAAGTSFLAILMTMVLAIEGSICVFMASPLFMLFAGLGGLLGYFIRKRRLAQRGLLGAACVLPFAFAPVEVLVPPPDTFHEVHSQIHIRADEGAVWREIKSVPAIAPAELPVSPSHLIGLPRPIEATLSHDGVGGVRLARFDRGLVFREEVTLWEPGRRLGFSIHAEAVPSGALDDHVAVGGRYFDVLDGTYEIERRGPRDIVLHLQSRHRLTTGFNAYAGWWSEYVMNDLQRVILEVIRARCEAHPEG